MNVAFTPALFKQPTRLREFLSGEAALARIKNEAVTPNNRELYFGRWEVVWILATAPFAIVLFIFSDTMSLLTYPLPCLTPSRFFKILSDHSLGKLSQLYAQVKLDKKILIPSINTYQLTSWDVYGQTPCPINKIENREHITHSRIEPLPKNLLKQAVVDFFKTIHKTEKKECFFPNLRRSIFYLDEIFTNYFISVLDALENSKTSTVTTVTIDASFNALVRYSCRPGYQEGIKELKKTLRNALVGDISFYSPGGVCRGAAEWFIYLFLHSSKECISAEDRLFATAKEFVNGVPSQGTLLQALHRKADFLGLQASNGIPSQGTFLQALDRRIKKGFLGFLGFQESNEISAEKLSSDPEEAASIIDSLQAGIYEIRTERHAVVYCKINKNSGFVWDSNWGLYSSTPKELIQMVNTEYPGGLKFSLYTLKSDSN